MNLRVIKALLILLLLAGAGIFLYPRVSGYVEHLRQAEVVRSYYKASAAITDEMYEEERNRAQIYNEALASEMDFDHAVSAARTRYAEEYKELLNTGANGVMGSIRIPKIGVELPIYHGTQERELARGVGHYEGTSLPVGGESTHAVLSGHRGLPSADLFTRLDELEEGDLFIINTLDRDLTYRVDQITTVLPDNTEYLEIEQGKDYVTLVTCTPYGVNSHRLLVRGVRTENLPVAEEDETDDAALAMADDHHELKELLKYSAVVLFILVFTAVLLGMNRNKKTKKRRRRNTQKRKKGKGRL